MPKLKTRATTLKDPSCIHNYKIEDKFEEFIELRKLLEEKGFLFPKPPMRVMNNIHNTVARRGWVNFCSYPQDPIIPVVKEFYSNLLQQDQHNIFVRQV